MPQLTAAEIVKHPEYKNVIWDLPPAKKDKVEIARGRPGGPFKIAYEVHGHGDTKLVVCKSIQMQVACQKSAVSISVPLFRNQKPSLSLVYPDSVFVHSNF